MKIKDELQQTKTLVKPTSMLTQQEKIDDLGKMKASVQANPGASHTKVVILGGLNNSRLTVYSHQVLSRGLHQKMLYRPVIYRNSLDHSLIEFDAFQTLTLFQYMLRLPFGSRLVSGISDNDLIDSVKFFDHMS